MANLAQELKRKRDAEARLRQLDSAKNITINISGRQVNPGDTLDETAHDTLDHTGLPGIPAAEAFTEAAHDLHDHTGVPGVGSGGGAFTDLTDVPSSYTGAGGKVVAVKEDASGLEFVTAPSEASAAWDYGLITDSAGSEFDADWGGLA